MTLAKQACRRALGWGMAGLLLAPALARAQAPRFVSLTAGIEVTCGTTDGGQAWCWGARGNYGMEPWTPWAVPGALHFTSFEVGFQTACGVASDGAIYCVGEDLFGFRPGQRSMRKSVLQTPRRLNRDAVTHGLRFRGVDLGGQAVCAVTDGGVIWCWGRNRNGQFGNGSQSDGQVDAPVAVDSTVRFTTVGVSGTHACALTEDGTAYCWGTNEYGQLGDGTTDAHLLPRPVAGERHFRTLSVSDNGVCGVTLEGNGMCWGGHYRFGAGDGVMEGRLVPTLVAGDHHWRAIARGVWHACGVTDGGEAWCWGTGVDGALGTGELGEPGVADRTHLAAASPVRVVNSRGFVAVAVGYDHSCAANKDGEVWCWGGAAAEQLGVPRALGRTGTPVRARLGPAGER